MVFNNTVFLEVHYGCRRVGGICKLKRLNKEFG
jgi:hypothetical protein